MKLSILIPVVYSDTRKDPIDALVAELTTQIGELEMLEQIEIVVNEDDGTKSIGQKRNMLHDAAKGEYLCFFDADDWPEECYLRELKEGMDKGVDVISLRGRMTTNGENPEVFNHSIRYREYKTNPEGHPIRYERYPNHLNCMKSSIAKKFRFPEKSHGEDTDFANQVFNPGSSRLSTIRKKSFITTYIPTRNESNLL